MKSPKTCEEALAVAIETGLPFDEIAIIYEITELPTLHEIHKVLASIENVKTMWLLVSFLTEQDRLYFTVLEKILNYGDLKDYLRIISVVDPDYNVWWDAFDLVSDNDESIADLLVAYKGLPDSYESEKVIELSQEIIGKIRHTLEKTNDLEVARLIYDGLKSESKKEAREVARLAIKKIVDLS